MNTRSAWEHQTVTKDLLWGIRMLIHVNAKPEAKAKLKIGIINYLASMQMRSMANAIARLEERKMGHEHCRPASSHD
jgi:hypothetical protein